ncbi:hypothetical protein OHR68_06960 [Spirillospora sp. NBC_00431]
MLAELSVVHLQAVFAGIGRRHDARGAPLSAATLNRIRVTLRTALNTAIRQGLIGDNFASRVELRVARCPRTGQRPLVAVWTAAQTAGVLHAIREHRLCMRRSI